MAEPLSITASIIALLQLTSKVVKYLNNASSASKDSSRILIELGSVNGYLLILEDLVGRADGGETSLCTVRSLGVPYGPLAQFKSTLERLAKHLEPVFGIKKAGKVLRWPFKKDEVTDMIFALERQKAFFILAMENDQIVLSQAIEHGLSQLRHEVKLVHQESRDDRETRILQSLSSAEPHKKHQDVRDRRLEGTGQWLLETDEFRHWCEDVDTANTLWCHGDPGVGKTVLSSLVVDNLNARCSGQDVGIAFHYFDYRDQENHAPVSVLRSLLKQLADMKSPLPPSIVQLSQQFKKQPGSLQLADLESALARLFQEFHKSFVIIDALDECEGVNNRKDFLQFLRSLEGTSVRVFVTSRPYLDDIKKTLSSSPHLKIEARDSDIEKYIINRIAKEEAIEDLIDESLKEEMIHTIVTGAQGMFLLPALQIQAILDQTSRTQIRNALKRMPKTLESVFEETLQRMQRQPESRATLGKKTLMWISHAKRLLLVEELRQALAVNLEDDQFDSDNSPTAKRIVDSCLGLVTINEEDATVRLVHYSVQEYLIQQRQILFDLGDQIIAKTCLAFLSFEIFEENKTLIPADSDLELCSPLEGEVTEAAGSELSDDGDSGGEFTSGRDSEEEYTYSGDSNKAEVTQDDDFNAQHDPKEAAEKIYNEKTNPDNRWPQYPLFNYAACYWGDHARTEPEGIVDSVYTFLQGPYKTTCAGLLLQKTRLNAYKRSMNVPILHLLSFLGLATIMKRLLDEGAKANSKSFAGQTPLMWAAKEGQILAAKSLLAQWDVEVNSRDVWSETALTHACLNGHPPLVKLLLEHGADVNARSPFIGTVLHEYVRIGDYAMTKLLLISGADVSATDDQRRVAIFHAAENGDERLIRLLITHGANLNVRDNSGNTVLHLAVLRRNFEATRLLLQVRVNVAIHNHLGKSAVHDAAGHSYEITRLLLDHGADIEMKDNQRRTALFEAITRRLEASVQLLLERGASIDVQDSIGDTGLHKAARRGFGAIVRLLLKNGADVKTKNGVGETALHSAASGDYYWDAILGSLRRIYSSHALRLQSRKRSRSNERYKEDLRETDLEYESIIQQLLEKGADVQAKDRNELTPLQRAIQKEHEGAVKLLTAASRGFGVH